MAREAPRTLFSLSTAHQRDVDAEAYEVIVVDNGSPERPGSGPIEGLSGNFRYLEHPAGDPSPVAAINAAAAKARGEMLGIIIDGARICTPGLIAWALRTRKSFDNPVVATLNWHLGPKIQNQSMAEGYDQGVEDDLLEQIRWPEDGYKVHGISALGGSSLGGYFLPVAESNAVFVTRSLFERLGGYDPRFVSAGGGLVNLDFYKRAAESPGTDLVMLLGEGTFHQVHGGIMTNAEQAAKRKRWDEFEVEYQAIRGEKFKRPDREHVYMGTMPPPALPHLLQSAENAVKRAGKAAGPFFGVPAESLGNKATQGRRASGAAEESAGSETKAACAPPGPASGLKSDPDPRPGADLKPGDSHYRAYVGPPENYDVLAALQFNLMTALGLRDYHHMLDVGCGSLRAGRLFIPYLLPGRYCGLEPEAWLIEQGIDNEIGRAMIELKAPRFDHNRDFNFAVFGRSFDFILAQSVLTHAGRAQVRAFLASTRACLAADGIAAFTYIRGREDHQHDEWVYPGITLYTAAFMAELAADAGLELLELDWGHPGNIRPKWLAVGHPGLSSKISGELIARRARGRI